MSEKGQMLGKHQANTSTAQALWVEQTRDCLHL